MRTSRRTLSDFLAVEALSGLVLVAATIAALVWANVAAGSYASFWQSEGRGTDPQHIVNNGLMALFFFIVGLEIKREIVTGQLRRPAVALLPVGAAIGGMALPALIYAGIN